MRTFSPQIFMTHLLHVSGSVLGARGAAGNMTSIIHKMHGKLEEDACYGKAEEGDRVGSTKVVTILNINGVVSVSLIEEVISKQRLVRGEGGTSWIHGERAFQAVGIASAKALKLKCT